MDKIFVTKSFLPPQKEYEEWLAKVWRSGALTNDGALAGELTSRIREYLGAEHFSYIANGTLALQLAITALNLADGGEIITTPFTYVATISSILWEKHTPRFVDVEPNNFTLDASLLEAAITLKTCAIMPVHVFGYACDVMAIGDIAKKHNLPVIYDAAHAFGSKFAGKALANYGDIACLSFHATKLFHTVEGGGCVIKDANVSERLELQRRFGQIGDEHLTLGINAKNSEFHAAMGLANLPYLAEIIALRRKISEIYDAMLGGYVGRPRPQAELEYNYAYYPVLFKDEAELLRVFVRLGERGIYPRRYFYPSLNKLTYIKNKQDCPVSEDISSRIACLPLWDSLGADKAEEIANIILDEVKNG